ncbi:MAG: CoA pyrophosphatase [Halofilum sp. (in: g-proteobacteria)]|nr:CoA pyrophosphatase [Halofilum sp. (in: g-proteobacteria)]
MTQPRQAAVLVPVYRDRNDRLRIALIRRVERGIHAGQIALPGGRVEAGDTSRAATALRETWEEIGVASDAVEILARLRPVRTRSSDYLIQPFLGRIEPPARWRPQPGEVAAVLTPTVAELAAPGRLGRAVVQPAGWPEPRRVPCLYLDETTFVWGATYRILRPLLVPLQAGRWPV